MTTISRGRWIKAAALALAFWLPHVAGSVAHGQEATPAAQPEGDVETPEDIKAACSESCSAPQKLRQAGQHVAAPLEAIACAQERCPEIVRPMCAKWLTELRSLVPSVVVAAKDAAGNDTADVRVFVDGKKIGDQLPTKPIVLDPGPHTFRFEHGSAPAIEKKIILAQGQVSRALVVRFTAAKSEPPPPPPPDPIPPDPAVPSTGVSPLVFAGFGVAAAGLISGTVTGILTLSNASTLRENCPNDQCMPNNYQGMDDTYALAHVSTASFAVAGAGAVVGLVGLLISGSSSAEPKAQEEAAAQPVLGLGVLGVRGAF